MKINCSKILVAAFNLEETIFNRHYEQMQTTFNQYFGNAKNCIELSTQEQFAEKILSDKHYIGVCFAQAGMSECISLNKIKGIRAAVVHSTYIAEMCRKHNDANVCIIGTDCIAEKLSATLIFSYACSAFDNEERNMLRLGKIADLEQKSHQ